MIDGSSPRSILSKATGVIKPTSQVMTSLPPMKRSKSAVSNSQPSRQTGKVPGLTLRSTRLLTRAYVERLGGPVFHPWFLHRPCPSHHCIQFHTCILCFLVHSNDIAVFTNMIYPIRLMRRAKYILRPVGRQISTSHAIRWAILDDR